ncbi:hypothetical protein P691DRAFT_809448 [Macrolepiota fuliginosa MF-IS2]|uniref:Yeast cell wall synthesis Kre9/Knh1-like N-terminal domain-containing protein n=1 Tax=Macrolepiota fuliginosa MF-IS2 TaxID=1400762 RepID=A0A9P6BZ56_9AGAR|nr:hypothetical protein P691DRAFT_809448 [Macrolepiota fuliginosa MF-IS2]
MFMKLSAVAVTLLAAFTGVSHAAPLDVYAPPLLTPTAGEVLIVGNQQNVTWDTSRPPQHITNRTGTLVLAKGGIQDYKNPLATGFDILDGWHIITVPNVQEGDDYQLVLFGDSGNYGPKFSIRY